jgi:(S)-ureidoglycine-glyoxylate aminotransferase
VVNFGRFGLLLQEILTRIGATYETVDAPWGEVVPMEAIAEAARRVSPKLICAVHGDTSTTMAQPLDGIGAIARRLARWSMSMPRPPLGAWRSRATAGAPMW